MFFWVNFLLKSMAFFTEKKRPFFWFFWDKKPEFSLSFLWIFITFSQKVDFPWIYRAKKVKQNRTRMWHPSLYRYLYRYISLDIILFVSRKIIIYLYISFIYLYISIYYIYIFLSTSSKIFCFLYISITPCPS